jgi:microcystin degradation protein MlrC
MIAEDHDDADGETVKYLREHFGFEKPIIMTLDCHANVSKQMVNNVDATILYRTNPHIDQYYRGIEAVDILEKIIKRNMHPIQYLKQLPLVINISKQNTSKEPLIPIIKEIEEHRTKKGVISVSLGLGFAFSDVEKMGASVLVITNNDYEAAERVANHIGRYTWNIRDRLQCELSSPPEAVQKTKQYAGPVLLMDVGDNVGGGSPGDSTILIREIMDQGLEKALVILTDPKVVQRCLEIPIGDKVTIEVGAKQDSKHGTPIKIQGVILQTHNGIFTEDKPRHGGQRTYNQGKTIVVKTTENHIFIVNSIRTPPFSLNQIISLGIDPNEMKIIIAKGVIAPLAAYQPIAEKIITVNTLGSTSADIYSFNYTKRRIPLYPLEMNSEYF